MTDLVDYNLPTMTELFNFSDSLACKLFDSYSYPVVCDTFISLF